MASGGYSRSRVEASGGYSRARIGSNLLDEAYTPFEFTQGYSQTVSTPESMNRGDFAYLSDQTIGRNISGSTLEAKDFWGIAIMTSIILASIAVAKRGSKYF